MTPRTSLALLPLLTASLGCGTPKHTKVADHLGNSASPLVVVAPAVDPKLVDMTAEATMSLLAANATTELGVRMLVTARDLPDAQRPPLNLGLVLDTSGSMDGDAIGSMKSSAKALVDRLRVGDRISIVTFHSHADLLVPSTVIDSTNRAAMDHAIDGIVASGTTDLQGGLTAGLAQVTQHQLPLGINRIVLLSDGVPNASNQLPATIASIHQYGISVTSLGFGIDYDTSLMTQIARDTGGTFHYLDKPEEVAAVFDDELTKMSTVVGRGLQLVLEPGPGVTILPMPGIQQSSNGTWYTTVGDLAAGETRDLMIPIKVATRAAGSTAELVQATLTFDDVIGKSGSRQRGAFVGVKTSTDASAIKAGIKVGLEVARIRASAAAAILTSMQLAREGQVAPARQQLALAMAAVRVAATKYRDAGLDVLLKQLDEVAKQLAQIAPPPELVDRAKRSSINDRPTPATAPASVERRMRRTEEKAAATLQGRD